MQAMTNENLELLKEIFLYRNTCIAKKNALRKRTIQAREFFLLNKKKPDLLAQGVDQFLELLDDFYREEKEIRSCDSAMLCLIETLLEDLEVSMIVPEQANDAGDIIPVQEITYKAKKDAQDRTITPKDLWTLMILKDMIKPNNISIKETK